MGEYGGKLQLDLEEFLFRDFALCGSFFSSSACDEPFFLMFFFFAVVHGTHTGIVC